MSATPAYAWEASVNGCNWFRVRATSHTSGTATWKMQRGTYATEPIPAAQVTGSQPVVATPLTPTASNIISAATTNATSIKTYGGVVYSITVSNSAVSPRYVKLYNKASAPTVGTDVPILTIPVGAGALAYVEFGALGHRLVTGIALAITANMNDNDATAIGASEVKVLTAYV